MESTIIFCIFIPLFSVIACLCIFCFVKYCPSSSHPLEHYIQQVDIEAPSYPTLTHIDVYGAYMPSMGDAPIYGSYGIIGYQTSAWKNNT